MSFHNRWTGSVMSCSYESADRLAVPRRKYAPPAGGAYFLLGTASLSALTYEHDMTEPVHRFWNEMRHLTPANE